MDISGTSSLPSVTFAEIRRSRSVRFDGHFGWDCPVTMNEIPRTIIRKKYDAEEFNRIHKAPVRIADYSTIEALQKFRDHEIQKGSTGKDKQQSSIRREKRAIDNFIDFIEKTQITKLPDLSKPLIEEFLAYSGARYFTPNPKRRETGDQKIFCMGNAEPPCARKPHRPWECCDSCD